MMKWSVPHAQVMMNAERNLLSLEGMVSFDTAARLANEGRRLLTQADKNGALSIDVRRVQNSSSATLTVVLEWWRALDALQLSLKAIYFPEQMEPLVSLSGLNRILPEH